MLGRLPGNVGLGWIADFACSSKGSHVLWGSGLVSLLMGYMVNVDEDISRR